MTKVSPLEPFFQEIHKGEVPHAILFHCPSVETLQSTAYSCASQIILKENPEAQVKIQKGIFPDIQEYGKNSNKNSSLSIDTVREIKRDIWIKPFEAQKKVFIIHSVDSMSIPAVTAFLKTLEEPPSHAVIILTTTKKYSLLPSLISRTRVIKVPCKEYNHLSSEERRFVLSMATGSLKLVNIVNYFQDKTKGESLGESNNEKKFSEKKIIRGLLDIFRDKALHHLGLTASLNKEYLRELDMIPHLPLYEVIEILQTAMDKLLLGSNKGFCFEWILLQLERLKQKELTRIT